MPTEKEAITAFDTLIASGFLESEVTLACGSELADRIRAAEVLPHQAPAGFPTLLLTSTVL
jgi:hypothetical protein